MTTDLQRLLDWYRSVGIEPSVAQQESYGFYAPPVDVGRCIVVTLIDQRNREAKIVFTPEGKFIRQDFWE